MSVSKPTSSIVTSTLPEKVWAFAENSCLKKNVVIRLITSVALSVFMAINASLNTGLTIIKTPLFVVGIAVRIIPFGIGKKVSQVFPDTKSLSHQGHLANIYFKETFTSLCASFSPKTTIRKHYEYHPKKVEIIPTSRLAQLSTFCKNHQTAFTVGAVGLGILGLSYYLGALDLISGLKENVEDSIDSNLTDIVKTESVVISSVVQEGNIRTVQDPATAEDMLNTVSKTTGFLQSLNSYVPNMEGIKSYIPSFENISYLPQSFSEALPQIKATATTLISKPVFRGSATAILLYGVYIYTGLKPRDGAAKKLGIEVQKTAPVIADISPASTAISLFSDTPSSDSKPLMNPDIVANSPISAAISLSSDIQSSDLQRLKVLPKLAANLRKKVREIKKFNPLTASTTNIFLKSSNSVSPKPDAAKGNSEDLKVDDPSDSGNPSIIRIDINTDINLGAKTSSTTGITSKSIKILRSTLKTLKSLIFSDNTIPQIEDKLAKDAKVKKDIFSLKHVEAALKGLIAPELQEIEQHITAALTALSNQKLKDAEKIKTAIDELKNPKLQGKVEPALKVLTDPKLKDVEKVKAAFDELMRPQQQQLVEKIHKHIAGTKGFGATSGIDFSSVITKEESVCLHQHPYTISEVSIPVGLKLQDLDLTIDEKNYSVPVIPNGHLADFFFTLLENFKEVYTRKNGMYNKIENNFSKVVSLILSSTSANGLMDILNKDAEREWRACGKTVEGLEIAYSRQPTWKFDFTFKNDHRLAVMCTKVHYLGFLNNGKLHKMNFPFKSQITATFDLSHIIDDVVDKPGKESTEAEYNKFVFEHLPDNFSARGDRTIKAWNTKANNFAESLIKKEKPAIDPSMKDVFDNTFCVIDRNMNASDEQDD